MMAGQGLVKCLGSGWAMDKFAFKTACHCCQVTSQVAGQVLGSGWAIDKFASKTASHCCQVTGQVGSGWAVCETEQ